MEILAIEEGKVFRDILGEIFISIGLTPTVVETAAEGLAIARQRQFDFICVALHLPDRNGIELVTHLRRQEAYKTTPILLFTSEVSGDVFKNALLAGVTDIFAKNHLDQLVVYLRRHIQQRQPIKGRVMYVEDTLSQQQLVTQYLEAVGLDVDVFSSAEAAWESYLTHRYDLVVTDIVLEGEVSGLTLISRIRRQTGGKGDIPILAVTGYDDMSRRIELFDRGVDDYCTKPIVEEELQARVRGLVHRKQLHDELIKSHQALANANAFQAEFMANVSHEIRTPLNGIMGMLELMKQQPLDSTLSQQVETAHSSSQTLLVLLNDILDLSRVEAGQLSLEKVPIDVLKEVHDCVELLKPQAEKKGLKLQLQAPIESLDQIYADPVRLRQVIINLVSNAIKFTQHGFVQLTLRIQSKNKQSQLRFEIEDSGVGIDFAKQEIIFQRFQQADGSTAREFGGAGLGLSISKHLVSLWQGEIGLTSSPGKGSCFWFTLPLERVASSASQELPIKFSPEGKKLLIVDDNQINQQVAGAYLKKMALDYDVAENGQEALEAMKNGTFDLVLMDCQMPLLDGYETTRCWRQLEQENDRLSNDHLSIVAMTANSGREDRQKCLAAGMDGFVAKPVKWNNLVDTLNRLLG